MTQNCALTEKKFLKKTDVYIYIQVSNLEKKNSCNQRYQATTESVLVFSTCDEK